MCAIVSSAFPQTHVVSPVYNFHFFPLCLAASIPCAQMVETSPCGPCAVITFCQLFVKVNDVYVRFIVQSLPPFVASNNFSWEVNRLYT